MHEATQTRGDGHCGKEGVLQEVRGEPERSGETDRGVQGVARQSNKSRILAVDITRLLAAFIVMYEHLQYAFNIPSSFLFFLQWQDLALHRVSPIFFLLAGYFACRNITWKKALNNAWWCLAPFILWNLVALCAVYFSPVRDMQINLHLNSLVYCFGYGSFLSCGTQPLNYPLWFMRDLFFLFLLSPVLFKMGKYIFPIIVMFAIIPSTADFLSHDSLTTLSLNSIAYFTTGCFLRSLNKDTQKNILEFYSPFLIVSYFIVTIGITVCIHWFGWLQEFPFCTFPLGLFSIWIVYQTARWIEVSSPKICGFALKFAPVTFLTFASHGLIYWYIPKECVTSAFGLVLVPIVCFIWASMLFFSLKRWLPSAIHLIAHYKLRLEDVQGPGAVGKGGRPVSKP